MLSPLQKGKAALGSKNKTSEDINPAPIIILVQRLGIRSRSHCPNEHSKDITHMQDKEYVYHNLDWILAVAHGRLETSNSSCQKVNQKEDQKDGSQAGPPGIPPYVLYLRQHSNQKLNQKIESKIHKGNGSGVYSASAMRERLCSGTDVAIELTNTRLLPFKNYIKRLKSKKIHHGSKSTNRSVSVMENGCAAVPISL